MINETIKKNIDIIVRDALHLLNNENITNYTEGEISEYVNYYIEQYREISDDTIENLLNQVDVILCTEEEGFDENYDEKGLNKLYDHWRVIEATLKKDILKREYLNGFSYEIQTELLNSILNKNIKYGGLTDKEEKIHLIRLYDEMIDYSTEELSWKTERMMQKIPEPYKEQAVELFERRNFSTKEIVKYIAKNYKK